MWKTQLAGSILSLVLIASATLAADGFELPPIEYSTSQPDNAISRLQSDLDAGTVRLQSDDRTGYLRSVLKALEVPFESQVLVFSQTSLQRHRITPETPRAIYFNDDVYVGFCKAGEVLEISTADTRLGTVFYTLNQDSSVKPSFLRQTDQCLQCHHSSRTEGIPGHLIRSLFVDPRGQPLYSGGSYTVDHTTPFENRWGGWWVTGTHGSQKHLGNLIITTKEVPPVVDNAAGQNLNELPKQVDVEEYLTPHSDIVALMVLEHQTLVHNRITKANFAARQALLADAEMRKILGEKEDQLLDSTVRRIRSAGEDLVESLLFVDEAKLTGPIIGTSGFAEIFTKAGPHDSQGRSLRDFDLKTRMFKYPCSYLIGSDSFQKLPPEIKDVIWNRLWSILVLGEDAKTYRHLSTADREAIVEIIKATHPDLPPAWSEQRSP
jgi:hypothetical protein